MMRRLLPPILTLICLGLMFLLSWLWPIMTFLRTPWNFVGLVPLVLGAAMGVAGIRQIKKSQTTIKPFGQPSHLLTDGIFRHTRNPIYLGLATMLAGAWLLLGTLSSAIGVLLFVVAADYGYIRFEEATLAKTFGQEYEQYKSRTRRWI